MRTGALLAALLGFAGAGLMLEAIGRPYIVVSPSMEPAIHAGDLFWLAPIEGPIDLGTVITYRMGESTITHRVIAVEGDTLVTQGDSNRTADPWPVPRSAVIGTPVLRLPYVGALIEAARRLGGLFLFSFLLPGVLIAGEVVSISRGARQSLTGRQPRGKPGEIPGSGEGISAWRSANHPPYSRRGKAIRGGRISRVAPLPRG